MFDYDYDDEDISMDMLSCSRRIKAFTILWKHRTSDKNQEVTTFVDGIEISNSNLWRGLGNGEKNNFQISIDIV